MLTSNVQLVVTQLEESKKELAQVKDSEEMWKEVSQHRISYGPFSVKDIVLFLKNEKGFYEAFNRGHPNRYLSDESKLALRSKDQVLGIIVEMTKTKAGKNKASNPYDLPPGDEYYRLTVELMPDLS